MYKGKSKKKQLININYFHVMLCSVTLRYVMLCYVSFMFSSALAHRQNKLLMPKIAFCFKLGEAQFILLSFSLNLMLATKTQNGGKEEKTNPPKHLNVFYKKK